MPAVSETSPYHRRMTLRLVVAAGVGAAGGLGSLLLPLAAAAQVLAGVCAALLAYSIPLMVLFVRLDEAETNGTSLRSTPHAPRPSCSSSWVRCPGSSRSR